MTDYLDIAATQGTRIFRMRIALLLARKFTMNEDYSATVRVLLENWIDRGEFGPIPWPNCPWANEWLRNHGYVPNRKNEVCMVGEAEITR